MMTRFRILAATMHPSRPLLVLRGVGSGSVARIGQRVVTPMELNGWVCGISGTPTGGDFPSTETTLSFKYSSTVQLALWTTLCMPGRELVLADCEWHTQLDAVLEEWESGQIIRMEFLDRLFGLLTPHNIDAVVANVPDPWRAELIEDLRGAAQHDEHDDSDPVIIRQGAYFRTPYEEERAEEIRREVEIARRWRDQFRRHLLPALRAWVADDGASYVVRRSAG